MNGKCFALIICFFSFHWFFATSIESLVLNQEKPVAGMPLGNLSGLTYCRGRFLAVSDKDDYFIYHLQDAKTEWVATKIKLPSYPVPKLANLSIISLLQTLLLQNRLDFEAITCDADNNIYIASELTNLVLKVTPDNIAQWLVFPQKLIIEANNKGLLIKLNAKLEGLAINPAGNRLWLIAERENRGILLLKKINNQWQCEQNCVLLSENKKVAAPKLLGGKQSYLDFGDAMFFKDKLFTLERLLHQICRRNTIDMTIEKCWSFKNTLIQEGKMYSGYQFGQAEALWLDDENAWIGIDNNGLIRDDGEARPIIYQFNAPRQGWLGE